MVETNIHYPTDSSLMGDGVRVLTRLMKRISEITGAAGTKLRNRTRSVKLRVVEMVATAIIGCSMGGKSIRLTQRMTLLPKTRRIKHRPPLLFCLLTIAQKKDNFNE